MPNGTVKFFNTAAERKRDRLSKSDCGLEGTRREVCASFLCFGEELGTRAPFLFDPRHRAGQ